MPKAAIYRFTKNSGGPANKPGRLDMYSDRFNGISAQALAERLDGSAGLLVLRSLKSISTIRFLMPASSSIRLSGT